MLSCARRDYYPHVHPPAWTPKPTEAAVGTVWKVRQSQKEEVRGALPNSALSLRDLSLHPGCRCPPGLFLQDSHCLPLSECPCLVGQKLMQPGLAFLLDNCSQW